MLLMAAGGLLIYNHQLRHLQLPALPESAKSKPGNSESQHVWSTYC